MNIIENRFTISYSSNNGDFLTFPQYVTDFSFNLTIIRYDKLDGWDDYLTVKIDGEEEFNVTLNPSSFSFITYYGITVPFKLKTKIIDNSSSFQAIPRLIIQTNEEYDKNDALAENSRYSLRLMNPEYNYVFFTKIERRKFIKSHFDSSVLMAYDTLKPGAFQADLFRYCFLYIRGGCYVDDKCIARKPFRDIIKDPNTPLIICEDYEVSNTIPSLRKYNAFLNAIMMSAPLNHNIKLLIDECVNNILNNQRHFDFLLKNPQDHLDMLSLTGPRMIFKVLSNKVDKFVKMKHIISNNDGTKYSNFQIVDIESGELLFTKTNRINFKEENHYSNLWRKHDIFYKNYKKIHNLIFQVDPNIFCDEFTFFVNDNSKFIVERSDSLDTWRFNLVVKITDDTTSESDTLFVGQRRCIPFQKVTPRLPENVFFALNLKSIPVKNERVLSIPFSLRHYVNFEQLKMNFNVSKVIVTIFPTTEIDEKDMLFLSIIADFVFLYTGTCSNYYWENNTSVAFVTNHITNLLQLSSASYYKPILLLEDLQNSNIVPSVNFKFLSLMCEKYMNSKFDKMEFVDNINNYIDCDVSQLFTIQLEKYKHILEGLNDIVRKSGEHLEGNIFYEHTSNDFTINKDFERKRWNIFDCGRKSQTIMEIGFNAGHSVFLYLIANNTSKIQLFDLGEHSYSRDCYNFLDSVFPNRLSILWGNSLETIENFCDKPYFDLIHIDGGHQRFIAESDIRNCRRFASPHTLVVFDDSLYDPLASLLQELMEVEYIKKLNFTYETKHHLLFQYSFVNETFFL